MRSAAWLTLALCAFTRPKDPQSEVKHVMVDTAGVADAVVRLDAAREQQALVEGPGLGDEHEVDDLVTRVGLVKHAVAELQNVQDRNLPAIGDGHLLAELAELCFLAGVGAKPLAVPAAKFQDLAALLGSDDEAAVLEAQRQYVDALAASAGEVIQAVEQSAAFHKALRARDHESDAPRLELAALGPHGGQHVTSSMSKPEEGLNGMLTVDFTDDRPPPGHVQKHMITSEEGMYGDTLTVDFTAPKPGSRGPPGKAPSHTGETYDRRERGGNAYYIGGRWVYPDGRK